MRGYIHYRLAAPPDRPADIDVRIGRFRLDPPAVRVIDRRFLVGDDYFACRDTYKILSWQVEITGWRNPPTTMRIACNRFGTAAIGSRLIDCMVRYHLNLRGRPAVHACGVVRDGSAFLLSGRSGVGKSTLAMRLLDGGGAARLLGDNWIILGDGQAYSLHLPINIYDYNVSPLMRSLLPRRLRVDMRLKKLARTLSGGYLKKSTAVVLRQVLPDLVAEQAPLRKVFLFSQAAGFAMAPLPRAAALDKLVANDMMDREAFARYMLAWCAVHPQDAVADHWRRLRANLDAALAPDAEFVDVTVPRRITPDIVGAIREAID
jgi:hypothetical protein